MTTLQSALQRLRAAKGDRIAACGPMAAQLHRLVQQNANRFHRRPIGPIGSVLGLKDNKCVLRMQLSNWTAHPSIAPMRA